MNALLALLVGNSVIRGRATIAGAGGGGAQGTVTVLDARVTSVSRILATAKDRNAGSVWVDTQANGTFNINISNNGTGAPNPQIDTPVHYAIFN